MMEFIHNFLACHGLQAFPQVFLRCEEAKMCYDIVGEVKQEGAGQQLAFMLTTPLACQPPPLLQSVSPQPTKECVTLLQSIFSLQFKGM